MIVCSIWITLMFPSLPEFVALETNVVSDQSSCTSCSSTSECSYRLSRSLPGRHSWVYAALCPNTVFIYVLDLERHIIILIVVQRPREQQPEMEELFSFPWLSEFSFSLSRPLRCSHLSLALIGADNMNGPLFPKRSRASRRSLNINNRWWDLNGGGAALFQIWMRCLGVV